MEKILTTAVGKSNAVLVNLDEENWPLGIITIPAGSEKDITKKIIQVIKDHYVDPENIEILNVRIVREKVKKPILTNQNVMNFDVTSIEDGEPCSRKFAITILATY